MKKQTTLHRALHLSVIPRIFLRCTKARTASRSTRSGRSLRGLSYGWAGYSWPRSEALFPFPLAVGPLRVGGVIAFVAFAVALGAELVLAIGRPERIWYEGRAAAESAKTLAWRYMVHGKTFEMGGQDRDRKLLDKLNDVLNELDALPVHPYLGMTSRSRLR